MQSIKPNTQNTPSLARRFAALAGLATLAIGLGGFVPTAQAVLQVYEGFNYTSGAGNLEGTGTTLNGQTGGTGFLAGSSWWAGNTYSSPYFPTPTGFEICDATMNTLWSGVLTSLPQTGNFAGSGAPTALGGSLNGNNPDHLWASRPLDPGVVATFTNGGITWMCFAQASNFKVNANGLGADLAIGPGYFAATNGLGAWTDNRGFTSYIGPGSGTTVGGGAIGIALLSNHYLTAGIWDPIAGTALNNTATTGYHFLSTTTNPIVCIAKIVWGDGVSIPTTVYQTAFLDGTVLSEDAFNSSGTLVSNSSIFDSSTYTNLLLGGARYNVDEIRVGTTFDDVVGIVPATAGPYWAPTSQGGSGTWDAATTLDWASTPNTLGTLPAQTTNTLIFAGTNGTVTVDGTVTPAAGLQFSVGGYTLVPGSSTPQISLTGANAAANTITASTGTTTNGVQVIGTAGMTKAGAGTLILSNTGNGYSGGTMLNAGILQIAVLGSLGSGNVTFGGGTLQYPPGSGSSPTDVSGVIAPVGSGYVAKIDPDGYDVTFSTGLSGNGGVALVGSGSLTLAGANTYTGPTTVSAGTLNISSASGVIATLNVPIGGTVNLGAGAVVGALNVTGGTVNMTGAGAQVGTLFVSSGSVTNPSSYALTVTNSANLKGVQLTLGGASSFTLNGADLVNPSTSAHRSATATGGTLSLTAAGLDAAIGIGNPGVPATAATTTYLGGGAWVMTNAFASDNNNVYGKDNHAFHYIIVATGDFDIECHVTSATGGQAGLMARDNLLSEWTSATGNYMGIWTPLGNPIQVCYATMQSAASQTSPPWVNVTNINPTPAGPAWLELKRTGNLITSYYSSDGSTYTQAQQVDYTASPWGATTYLGLDLTSQSSGGGSGSFDNVNFMGTAGSLDVSKTEFALSGGAQLSPGPVIYVASISTNGTALPSGCWGATGSGAANIDDVDFILPGIAVISPAVAPPPLAIATPTDIATNASPGGTAVVYFPDPAVSGGTLPIVSTNFSPASGSAFPIGTNLVVCSATDSTCPLGESAYAYFHVIVNLAPPPPPELTGSGFIIAGGQPTFTFTAVQGYWYRLVSSTNVAAPLSEWQGVVIYSPVASDANGWVYCDGVSVVSPITLQDPTYISGIPQLYYRIEASPTEGP